METVNRRKISEIQEREDASYRNKNPKSYEIYQQTKANMFSGVPMHWMADCLSPFPTYFKEAHGAHVTDVDDNDFIDLCLGGSGSLFGYANPKIVEAVSYQIAHGATSVMPTEDAYYVGFGLQRIFGLPFWQVTVSASEANRTALRLCRILTKRHNVLVFKYCYHGTVDEAWEASIDVIKPASENGVQIGTMDMASTTRVVEFNDIDALEKSLLDEQVACVLTEPVITTANIVHPSPGFHEALRELTKKTKTLLIMDETQTVGTGYGGYSRINNLEPDIMVLGKPMAGGIPVGLLGMSQAFSKRVADELFYLGSHEHLGMGGTLAGSPIQMKAIRATVEHVMTEDNYGIMLRRADQLQEGMERVIADYRLPWSVLRLGSRLELYCLPEPPNTATEAMNAQDIELESCLNIYAHNRGVMLSPYSNTAVACPVLTKEDVDKHNQVFESFIQEVCN